MNAYEKRRENAYRLFGEAGYSKAIIGDPMEIYYLTGRHIIPYERFYGLVLDIPHQNAKMINPSVDIGCMKDSGIEEVVYTDTEGPASRIASLTSGAASIAVDRNYYSMAVGDLFPYSGEKIGNAGKIIARLRMKKDAEEIKIMRFAAEIVDKALDFVKNEIRPGMSEKELYQMLYSFMSKFPDFNTDEVIILALGGPHSANPHGASGDYRFQPGDFVLMDFCAYYKYYWSDITRCMFLGEPSNSKLPEIYHIVKGANQAAFQIIRPGIKAKEIDRAARDYITEAGYGEYFLHRTGHGLGLSVHEEPYITPDNELIMEEGMTHTDEPGIYLDGIGGIRLEDDILVTHNGAERLTQYSKNFEDMIIPI